MSRSPKLWLVVAVLFVLVNAGGAIVAAAEGELLHACGHVALLIAGVVAATVLARRRTSAVTPDPDDLSDSLAHLEHSLDAVAIEVERMGEGQRYMTNLFVERGGAAAEARDAERVRPAAESQRDAGGTKS